MNGGNPLVVSPTHQKIADVNDEALIDNWHVRPIAAATKDLKSAGGVLALEDGECTIVRVGTGAQLPRLGRPVLRGVIVDAHVGDVPFAALDKKVLVKIQRKREDAHEPHR